MERTWRLYLDTSVFGGCFDVTEGWDIDSRRVVEYCTTGKALLLTTDTVIKELESAPEQVRSLYDAIPHENRLLIDSLGKIAALADSYLAAGVIGGRWWEDCVHVAAATIARADAIVSWNFKHIVRLDRIRAFNTVNLAEGYGTITILSPKEVNIDEQ